MTEEKNVFLTRKPKIFLVGNPEKLGYKANTEWTSQSIDSSGVTWWTTATWLTEIIYNEGYGPYGVHAQWINKTFHYIEAPKLNIRLDKQGYEEMDDLASKAKDKLKDDEFVCDLEAAKKLFSYSPPITDYAIPREGTRARKMFSAFAKVWQKEREDSKQIREQLMKLVEKIR